MARILIVLPSECDTGPVKGAYAIANILCEFHETEIIFLKPGSACNSYISPRVKKIQIRHGSLFYRFYCLYKIIKAGRKPILISMCFSADVISSLIKGTAAKLASIRSNIEETYKYDYGYLGFILTHIHKAALKRFDRLIVMSSEMRSQLKMQHPQTIILPNFIEEDSILRKTAITRSNKYVVTFLGLLINRKAPLELLRAFKLICTEDSSNIDLWILGDGPLLNEMVEYVRVNSMSQNVFFYGYVKNPYSQIAMSDCVVIPSYTEGISRASLESLFLGVPCVLRNVDSNPSLITPGKNGYLFSDESSLVSAIKNAVILGRQNYIDGMQSLLPRKFSRSGAQEILNVIVESVDNG